MRRILGTSAIIFIATLLVPGAAFAQTSCAGPAATAQPALLRALESWQATHRSWLEPAFRAQIASDFCNASRTLIAEERATAAQIGGVAAGAVEDFLLPYLRDEPARTMSSALRARLGVAGMFRPYARPQGTILFRYRRDVEMLSINGDTMSRVERVIISPGEKSWSGLLRGRPVCSGNVVVRAAQTVQAEC